MLFARSSSPLGPKGTFSVSRSVGSDSMEPFGFRHGSADSSRSDNPLRRAFFAGAASLSPAVRQHSSSALTKPVRSRYKRVPSGSSAELIAAPSTPARAFAPNADVKRSGAHEKLSRSGRSTVIVQ